jgi:tRNA dimethylallyltransferase
MMDVDRQTLYHRINTRVDEMITAGLMEEVKSVHLYKNLKALQTVSYSELFDYFDGKCSLPEAIEKIKQHTRNYAKRQLTWFRNEKDLIPHKLFSYETVLLNNQ